MQHLQTHLSHLLLTPPCLQAQETAAPAVRRLLHAGRAAAFLQRGAAPEPAPGATAVPGRAARAGQRAATAHRQPRRAGAAIDWVLRMRRFARAASSMPWCAPASRGPSWMPLPRTPGALSRAGAGGEADSDWGRPAQVGQAIADVLDQLAALPVGPTARAWLRCAPGLARASRPWLGIGPRAAPPARVRECHGDLHLGNVVRIDGEITAFDCLEFSPALRWIDTLADTGFLTMDLHAHGRPDLAWRFLDAYLAASGDYAGLAVLRPTRSTAPWCAPWSRRLRAQSGGGAPGPDYLACAERLAAPWARACSSPMDCRARASPRRPRQLLQQGGAAALGRGAQAPARPGAAGRFGRPGPGHLHQRGLTPHLRAAGRAAGARPACGRLSGDRGRGLSAPARARRLSRAGARAGPAVRHPALPCRPGPAARARAPAPRGGRRPSEADLAVLARQQQQAEPWRPKSRSARWIWPPIGPGTRPPCTAAGCPSRLDVCQYKRRHRWHAGP